MPLLTKDNGADLDGAGPVRLKYHVAGDPPAHRGKSQLRWTGQGSWLEGPLNSAPPVEQPGYSTLGGTPVAVQALLAAFRSNAPGAWADNPLEQTNHFTGPQFIAINTLMKQAAASELKIYRRDPDDPEKKTPLKHGDPAMRIFHGPGPNPREGWRMFLRRLVQQHGLTGTALVWNVPNGAGKPCEMYILPTALATPLPQFMGYLNGAYRIQPMYPYGPFNMWPGMASAMGCVIPNEQIFKVSNPHPLLTYTGYSDLTAMRLQADTVEAIDRGRWATQFKGVDPSGVLSLPQANWDPDTPDLKRMRAEWEAFYAGPANQGKTMIMTGDAKWTPTGNRPVDMAYESGWDQLIGFIFGGYGVMKAVAGVSDAATFAGLFAAIKQFNLMSLMPLLAQICEVFNKFLMPRFHPDYVMELTPERIDDPANVIATNAQHITVGCMTRNEWRKMHDMDETTEPWGEELAGSKVLTRREEEAADQAMKQQEQKAQQEADAARQTADAAVGGDKAIGDVVNALGADGADKNPLEKERPFNAEGAGSLGPRKSLAASDGNGHANGWHEAKALESPELVNRIAALEAAVKARPVKPDHGSSYVARSIHPDAPAILQAAREAVASVLAGGQ